MKYLKTVFGGIMIFVIIFCLTACSNNKKQSINNNLETSETMTKYENDTHEYSQTLSSIFNNEKGTYSLISANTENEIISSSTSDDTEKYYSLLYFTDYNTGEKIILCNKPDCSHNNSIKNS